MGTVSEIRPGVSQLDALSCEFDSNDLPTVILDEDSQLAEDINLTGQIIESRAQSARPSLIGAMALRPNAETFIYVPPGHSLDRDMYGRLSIALGVAGVEGGDGGVIAYDVHTLLQAPSKHGFLKVHRAARHIGVMGVWRGYENLVEGVITESDEHTFASDPAVFNSEVLKIAPAGGHIMPLPGLGLHAIQLDVSPHRGDGPLWHA